MNDLRTLPLSSLVLSNTQAQLERRAHFDSAKLAELAESIKTVGLLSPLVARPARPQVMAHDPDGEPVYEVAVGSFELVAGERRFLAAQLAGLTELPVSVRDLTDEQVLEVQLVENLQREDLHELAEAEGYEQLQRLGHSVEEIAEKTGKSKATVYARCKLLSLFPEAREQFRRGRISASVALLVARIPDDLNQAAALNRVTQGWGDGPMSYREAQEYIQREFTLRLDEAPFDPHDEQLVPEAGACSKCPKRTGNQPELFADIERGDVCTDIGCFKSKRAAQFERKVAAAREAGTAIIQPDKFGHSPDGYIELDQPCYEDAKRRTYRELLGDDAPAPALVVNESTREVWEVVRESHVAKRLSKAIEKPKPVKHTDRSALAERQADPAIKRREKLNQRIFRAIFDASPTNLREAANFAAADAMRAFGYTMEVCEALGWDDLNMDRVEQELAKLSNNDIARLLRVLPLCEYLGGYGDLSEAAKAAKVNVKLLEQQLDAELAAKASPAPAAKKKAAKKAPRKPK